MYSSSSGSSGVPGIGYLSGKTVKWVGVQILNAVDPVVIIVRRRYIHRLIKRIRQISVEKRADWMVKRELTILRAVEDLLELSMSATIHAHRASKAYSYPIVGKIMILI